MFRIVCLQIRITSYEQQGLLTFMSFDLVRSSDLLFKYVIQILFKTSYDCNREAVQLVEVLKQSANTASTVVWFLVWFQKLRRIKIRY